MCKLRANLVFICDMHASCSLHVTGQLVDNTVLGPVWQSAYYLA